MKWRNQSAAANSIDEQNVATKGLKQAMVNLLAVVENYPELKADAHFLELMQELSRIEDKLNDSRRYYNGTVREYNQTIEVFPKNIVARMFHFQTAAFFAEDVEAKKSTKRNLSVSVYLFIDKWLNMRSKIVLSLLLISF